MNTCLVSNENLIAVVCSLSECLLRWVKLKLRLWPLGHAAVELESGKVVRPCVRLSTVFPGNRSKDFSETWSEVKGG